MSNVPAIDLLGFTGNILVERDGKHSGEGGGDRAKGADWNQTCTTALRTEASDLSLSF